MHDAKISIDLAYAHLRSAGGRSSLFQSACVKWLCFAPLLLYLYRLLLCCSLILNETIISFGMMRSCYLFSFASLDSTRFRSLFLSSALAFQLQSNIYFFLILLIYWPLVNLQYLKLNAETVAVKTVQYSTREINIRKRKMYPVKRRGKLY